MSLNELGEKLWGTIVLGKFVNNPESNSHWLLLFGKCFHWSKFKARSHDIFFSWTFDLILINSRYLVLFISHYIKEILYVNTNFMGSQLWSKTNIFSCFWDWCWKNLFFNEKLKLLLSFDFSQFHEHICRSSHTQMFFKIGALKSFLKLRIKKRLRHRCFPVRSSH